MKLGEEIENKTRVTFYVKVNRSSPMWKSVFLLFSVSFCVSPPASCRVTECFLSQTSISPVFAIDQKLKLQETCGSACWICSPVGFRRGSEVGKWLQTARTVNIYWRTRPGAAVPGAAWQGRAGLHWSNLKGCRFLFVYSQPWLLSSDTTPNPPPGHVT